MVVVDEVIATVSAAIKIHMLLYRKVSCATQVKGETTKSSYSH